MMGLFNLFRKPVIIQDEFFGKLRYMRFKDSSKSGFEGKGFFAPTNSEIEYFIEADITGPTEHHRTFYKNLQENFVQYVEKIKPLLEDEFRNWRDDFKINEFNNDFSLVFVTIPRASVELTEWELVFTTIHDENHDFTISFIGDDPNGVFIAG